MDKRTYLEYYISILKRKQILIFTFYTNNDYNLRSMKISLFLFSFALNYAVNTLFYNDNSMHKIYEEKGAYNIWYQMTNILYTAFISEIIIYFFEYLALTEDNIIQLIKNISLVKTMKLRKCIKLKFILYYIFNFSFLLLFWSYISCFCLVYKNSQTHVIKDSFFSFGISSLYPIGLSLLPGILRIIALRAKKGDQYCLYKISQFLADTNPLICC